MIERHVCIGDLGCIAYLDDGRVIFCIDTTYRLVTDSVVRSISKEEADALTEGQNWESPKCYQKPIQAEINDHLTIFYCQEGEPFFPCWFSHA